jgi:hypothetical protein
LWLDKSLTELTDGDFDAAITEAGRANVAASTTDRFGIRTAALRQICFQQGHVDRPPRDPRPAARTSVDHAADIAQPVIRRDVVRYAQHITTTRNSPGSISSTAPVTSSRSWFGQGPDRGGERTGPPRPSG